MAILAKAFRSAIVASVAACGGHSGPGGQDANGDNDYGFVGSGGYGHLDGGHSLDDGGSLGLPDGGRRDGGATGNNNGNVDSGGVGSPDDGSGDDGASVADASTMIDGGSGVGVYVNTASGFFVFMDWSISGPRGFYSGRVYFGDAHSIEFVVGGVQAGSGYTITLTGTDRDGQPCTGTSAPFEVMAGSVTGAPVLISCPYPIDSGTAVITDM